MDARIVCLARGDERYILFYPATRQGQSDAMRALARWAIDKELSFTWYDSARLSSAIRKQADADKLAQHTMGRFQ